MNKIQLIDAETLYYKPLAHPRMLIDGILADGLAVMAGDSKIGKSWMVLWLCLQISKGEPVWGIPTRKTDVVYLALEDREWRIQQRMQELTEAPPENLHFGFSCGQLGSELESQIEAVLQDYPSTGLIFIDTLQMIRDNVSGKVNAYAQDYTILFNLSGDTPELCKEKNRLQFRKSGYSLKVAHNMLLLFTWPILKQFTPEKVKDLISYYRVHNKPMIELENGWYHIEILGGETLQDGDYEPTFEFLIQPAVNEEATINADMNCSFEITSSAY